ncbi:MULTISPECIES: serine/threonine-protein kinase [Sorangium]|uniref:Protein kinase n=1 Tax=Sorangium cellulosum (strain So ce56) TaxID=448385 RepID=A9F6S1_SORC5|nr:serine/threonine-protein kinase [Sorangium cellulosum]CAN91463.1 Protein kinase [Sorangium cellulosum So ce56]
MRLEPGSHVAPHLTLDTLLRMGGVGSIWTAHHLGLDKEVAVKFISASLATDATAVARFHREGALMARIKSPHVAEVYEHGVAANGLSYIVMELLRGEELSDRLARAGRLPLEETLALVSQLCTGLTAAHNLGVIHRDITPEHVFLADTGGGTCVKLLDFGVARGDVDPDGTTLTNTGAVVGSLVYMSPEQFFNPKLVDGRSDLWSVGIMAYHALTGAPPFEQKGIEALLGAIRLGTFSPPSQRCAEITPALDAWFVKALAREPSGRFGSAEEMSEALRRAAAGPPGPGSAPPRVD